MGQIEREAAVADLALLEQPLRRELYALLVQRNDWLSRDDAAVTLNEPRSVVAFHLDKLADAGLVEVRYERLSGRAGPGAGRPAKLYRRSGKEVSVSLPDRRYDLAASLLAEAVATATATGRPVAEALTDAARVTGREIGETVRRQVPRTRSAAAVRAAAMKAVEQLGYEPHEKGPDIVLSNCPFHSLAEKHRSLVCAMNLDLLRGLAEGLGEPSRLAPRLDPAEGMCCVRLRAR